MNITQFLLFLFDQGIQLSIANEDLIYKANSGEIPEKIRTQIEARKHEIVTFLNQSQKTDAVIAKSDSYDQSCILASDFQKSIWFLCQLENSAKAYQISSGLRFKGQLNFEKFSECVHDLVERHLVFKTSFVEKDGELFQKINNTVKIKIDLYDHGKDNLDLILDQFTNLHFDFQTPPLFKVAIVTTGRYETLCLLSMHHIISDGWSIEIFVRELSRLYNARVTGVPCTLDPLPIQYADYARWQRQHLTSATLERLLTFWRDRLSGLPALLELPTDVPRPAEQTFEGALHTVGFSPALTDRVRALAREEDATPFMLLLAVFQLLLSRYTGSRDIAVGTPVANRHHPEVEGVIGLFVNTLVLRSSVAPDRSFRTFLQAVKEGCLQAFEHQALPFDLLVDDLNPERSLSYSPLFQVQFILHQDPLRELRFANLEVEPLELEHRVSKFDISLEIRETAGGFVCYWEYNTTLFRHATICQLAEHFRRLLEGVLSRPRAPLKTMAILSADEQTRLLVAWNRTRAAYPPQCIHRFFEAQAERIPDQTALVCGGDRLSYGELNRRANRLAHYLREQGVAGNSLVGLSLERSPELVIGLVGILKAGGAYVPLDPDYPEARLAWMMEDAGIVQVLTQQKFGAYSPFQKARVCCLDDAVMRARLADSRDSHNLPDVSQPSDLAYVMYTSGSTGRPKGVMIQHRALVNRICWMQAEYHLTEADRVLQKTPFSFDVSVWEFTWPLMVGARLVLARPEGHKDPAYLCEVIREQGISHLHFVPSLLSALLDQEAWSECRTVKRVFCSGEALPKQLVTRFFETGTRSRLYNLYGPTEAAIDVSHWPCLPFWPEPTIPIGRPIQNVRLYVLDRDLNPVPAGVLGELHIGGDCLAVGYLNRPDLTRERFIPDPFSEQAGDRLYKTGDLVRQGASDDEGGPYLEYVGRLDHQVKIRGFRIELEEIEAVLSQQALVKEVLVAAVNEAKEPSLVAYVVLQSQASDREASTALFLKHVKEQLPDYMIPGAFVYLESFPLTANGKIDRKALPEPERSLDRQRGYVAPRTEGERQLVGIWSEVLGLETVGIHDNFFEIGGHSLLAVRLVSRIFQDLRIRLSLRSIFLFPSVSKLAEYLDEAEVVKSQPVSIPVSEERGLPSFSQQRMWFIHRLMPETGAYNMPAAIRMIGAFDKDAFLGGVESLLHRHESLRTHIRETNGEPEVVVDESPRFVFAEKEVTEKELPSQVTRLAYEPFSLQNGSLLRIYRFVVSQTETVVLLSMHHIISDGWSIEIFVRELSRLYNARVTGVPCTLDPLPIQYADYARWQRQHLTSATLERLLTFWRDRLSGLPALLELPTDVPRPAEQTFEGALHTVGFSPALTDRVRALAREEDATPFMLLLAVFQLLLSRYTGSRDIAVGTPVANRHHPEVEGVIGLFVNTLVLRSSVAPDRSFRTFLQAVKEGCLQAFEHQALPFDLLVDDLNPERSLSYSPLFQVQFILHQDPLRELRFANLEVEPLELEHRVSKFDISLEIRETAGGFVCYWEYNTTLFRHATICQLAEHFRRLLEGVLSRPRAPLKTMAILSADEQTRLLVAWNRTRAAYPPQCIHRFFEAQAERIPDQTALVCGGDRLSYGELNRRANRLAHYLREQGVAGNSLVGLSLERSPELVIGLVGILKAGGAYVPLDPDYPEARLAWMMEDAGIVQVLTQQKFGAYSPFQKARVCCLDDAVMRARLADSRDSHNLPDVSQPSDLAYVMYTSGSTGRPKGVMIQHRALVNRICWMQAEYHLTEADRVLQKTPFSFDVSVWEFTWPLMVGARLVLARPEGHKDPAYLCEVIREQGISHLHFVPSLLSALLDQEAWSECRTVKRVFCSGEALPKQLVTRFFETGTRSRLYNLYGPTEAAIDVSHWPCLPLWPEPTIPIGRPIQNVRLYVLDRDLNPVPAGVLGELHIGGDCLAVGYLNRPDLTRERFIPDPFSEQAGDRLYKTGDLVRQVASDDEGGPYLEYVGRLDHQVKIRGFRIELEEIEAVLSQQALVKEVLVAAVNEAKEPSLVAYVVLQSQASDREASTALFLKHVKEQLPDYMIPGAFVYLESFPLTANGKIDRKALPEPERSLARQRGYVAPRTEGERQLAGIWSEVLGLETVGIHDNFFEIGGHSLLAVRLVSRIFQDSRIRLPLRSIFLFPSVSKLAEHLDEAEVVKSQPVSIPVSEERGLPSFSQQRMWFIHRLMPETGAYNMPAAIRMIGAFNKDAFLGGVESLLHRHESLRTHVREVNGEPEVVVDESPRFVFAEKEVTEKELPSQVTRLAYEPFSLQNGPLLRIYRFVVSQTETVVLLSMHHIISDGWSIEIFVRELSRLYNARVTGTPCTLDPLPIRYADYARWQRQHLTPATLDKLLTFWRDRLSGLPALLELPTDVPRPAEQTFEGALHTVGFSPDLTDRVRALAREEDATPFMLLLAVFQLLLSRYTGSRDIAVGTPVANRHHPEVEGVIGLFVNTLVLRSSVAPDRSFRTFLQAVKEGCLQAFEHQALPFDLLVDDLNPERSLSYSPLFQVQFILHQDPLRELRFANLEVEPLELEHRVSKFDISLEVRETAGGFVCYWEYNTTLFRHATICQLAEHFRRLLEGVLSRPRAPLKTMAILSADEQTRLLVAWNRTRAAYPPQCIHRFFEAQAERIPDQTALVCGGDRLSYGELNRRANRLAHYLREQGVAGNSLVGLSLERSPELVIGLVGILKAGGAYVPLDPDYPEARLAWMMEDAGIVQVLTQQKFGAYSPFQKARVCCLDDAVMRARLADSRDSHNLPDVSQPSDLAYVMYTSGSTGRPKGVMIQHRALVNRICWMQAEYHLTEADRVLQKTPFSFDVSVWEFTWPLMVGARLVLARPEGHKDPAYLCEVIREQGISHLHFVPSLLSALLDQEAWSECRTVKRVFCSGEALPKQLATRFFETGTRSRLYNLYGPTEAAIDVSHWPCLPLWPEPTIPIGRPIQNVRLYVLDRDLNPVPAGVLGELHIGGDCLAMGYLNRPDLTRERFIPDPFSEQAGDRLYKTGDLVRQGASDDEGGPYLEYVGRLDHQVKIRGFRIELEEIEAVLSQQALVKEVLVAAVNEAKEPSLVAYVVLQSQASDREASTALFLKHVKEQLPDYMIPGAFVYLESFPLTANGKIDRKALPEPERSLARQRGYVAPRTEGERQLAGIWSEVLGLETVGIHDNFFEIGGHSLLAVKLVNRLKQVTGKQFALKNLFEHPTIADAVTFLDRSGETILELPTLVVDEENRFKPFALTDVQHAYWIGRKGLYSLGNTATYAYTELWVKQLDLAKLVWCMNRLIKRHEMLRIIVTEEGQQRILEAVPDYRIPVTDMDGSPQTSRAFRDLRNRLSHRFCSGADWPLFHLQVTRIGGKSVVHCSWDALMIDASSSLILYNELMQLYEAPETVLPPLAISFRDYVLAEQTIRTTSLYACSKAYWCKRLDGFPMGPELPLKVNPATIQEPRFERRSFRLSEPLWSRLKEQGTSLGLTPTAVILGCFAEVLKAWSYGSHFTLNLTLFNRLPLHPEVDRLVGDFTSLTLLEVDLRETQCPGEAARQLQRRLWEDLEHRYFSGIEVQRELSRLRGGTVVMPVVVTSTLGLEGKSFSFPGGSMDTIAFQGDEEYGISQTSQVWLDHQLSEREGALVYNWDSVQGLFPDGLLDEMFDAYKRLLQVAATETGYWEATEPNPFLEKTPLYRVPFSQSPALPANDRLHDLFLRQVAVHRDKIALFSHRRSLTYGELERQSCLIAQDLLRQGVQAGDLVAIVMHKGWEQVAGCLGIMMAGAAYLPVDAALPEKRIASLLGLAGVHCVLTTEEAVHRIPEPQGVGTVLVTTQASGEGMLPAETTPAAEDLAYVIYTSGSTGVPKGVAIEHRSAVNTIRDINQRFDVTSRDVVLGLSSLSFDLSVYDLFGILAVGGTLVLPDASEDRDPEAWLRYLREQHVSVWNTVPALLQMLMDQCEFSGVPSGSFRLRLVMLSGDWVPLTLPQRVTALWPEARLISLGGATEASIWSIYHAIERVDAAWKSIPYGKPLANQSVHVLNSALLACPTWVAGDLYIGGAGLARAYWKDDEKTRTSFITHPLTGERLYKTGDMGRFLPDGTIEFLGRTDFQVKLQGYRVELGEIEARLIEHDSVRNAVVTVLEPKAQARTLAAYVIPSQSEEGGTAIPDPVEVEAGLPGQEQVIVDPLQRSLFKLERHGLRQLPAHPDSIRLPAEMTGSLSFRDRGAVQLQPQASPVSASDFFDLFAGLRSHAVKEMALPKYYYPSAGSLYPVQTYVYVKPNCIEGVAGGAYYYNPDLHQLDRLSQGELPDDRCPAHASFLLFLVADLAAIDPLYGNWSRDFCYLEAGYMGYLLQNHRNRCLGLTPVSVPLKADLKDLLQLSASHLLVQALSGERVTEREEVVDAHDGLLPEMAGSGSPWIQLPCHLRPEQMEVGYIARQSYRSFEGGRIELAAFGRLMEAFYHRFARPSQPSLAIYVGVKPDVIEEIPEGYYAYDRRKHGLVGVASASRIDPAVFGSNSKIEQESGFSVFVVDQQSEGGGQRGAQLYEAGYLGQRASHLGLEQRIGLCAIGTVASVPAARALHLEPNDEVLHSFLGGKITEVQQRRMASYPSSLSAREPGVFPLDEIRDYLQEHLPAYMIPQDIVPLPSFPLTANGKIDRRALPEPERSLARQRGYVAPRTEGERQLVGIWSEVLGLETVGIHDNFFEIGGHSLLAVKLVNRLKQVTGKQFALKNLFEHPTIADAVTFLDRSGETILELPTLVVDEENRFKPFALTDVQHAYWIGRKGLYSLGNTATYAYTELWVKQLDLAKLVWCMNRLIKRHEMLRIIVTEEGQQRILEAVPDYRIPVTDMDGSPQTSRAFRDLRNRLSHRFCSGADWPLFHLQVTRIGGKSVVHCSWDALMIDASSSLILYNELMQLYEAPETVLPPLAISFRDYVLAEQTIRTTSLYACSKAYWCKRLDGFPMGPELPLKVNPATIQEPRFERRSFRLSEPLWSRLKEQGTSLGLTPTAVILGCFAEVLKAWSYGSHFTLNLTLFNRLPLHPEVDRLVGDFTSLTLLEVDLRETQCPGEAARQLQRRLWEDLEHRYFSGIEVQRELSRLRGGTVVMPVVVTSTLGLEGKSFSFPGGSMDTIAFQGDEEYGISQTSQVWLDHQLSEREGALVYNWDSVQGLFPDGLLDEMFDAYKRLLQVAATETGYWEATEPNPFLEKTPLYRVPFSQSPALPANDRLHDLFLRQVAVHRDKIALFSHRRSLTYGELERQSCLIAQDLLRQGVQAGDLVAIVMHKGWEQVAGCLGIMMAGAAYLPVDAALPEKRIASLLGLAGVHCVLTTEEAVHRIPEPQGVGTVLVTTQASGEGMLPAETTPAAEDLAYVIYTSGSTGVPKGVAIEHRSAVNTIRDINQRFDVTSRDVVLGLSSLSFDLSVYDLFGILAVGGTLVLPDASEDRDPEAWLRYLREQHVSVWNTVPALLQMLMDQCEFSGVPSGSFRLRLVMLSGDWVPLTLPQRVTALWPEARLISLGGATEASIWSIYHAIERVDAAWKSIPYGKPLANQSVHVLNSALLACPTWVAGDLYIGGAGLARAYWKDDEKTRTSFITHPLTGERLYKTGDMGRFLPDGTIEFLGRTDFQVKLQGYRVELGEIEARLIEHDSVRNAVVTVLEPKAQARTLAAYVIPSQSEEGGTAIPDPVEVEAGLPGQEQVIVDPLQRSLFKLERHGLRQLPAHPDSIRLPAEMTGSLSFRDRGAVQLQPQASPVSASDFFDLFAGLRSHAVKEMALPKYYYPSAGSLYPVQTYVYVKPNCIEGVAGGAYYYNPDLHQLDRLSQGELPDDRCPAHASFLLFLVADLAAIDPLYGNWSRDFCYLEAGYMGYLLQNHRNRCLGLTPVSVPLKADLKDLLQLSASHLLVQALSGERVTEREEVVDAHDGLLPEMAGSGSPWIQLPCHLRPEQMEVGYIARQSYRSFEGGRIELAAFGRLMEAFYHRFARPSQPSLAIYVGVKPDVIEEIPEGYYAYDRRKHGLVGVASASRIDPAVFGSNSKIEQESGFSVFVVDQQSEGGGQRGAQLYEAGYLGQRASHLGLEQRIGLCAIGTVASVPAARALHLEPNDEVLHSFLGGKITEVQQRRMASYPSSLSAREPGVFPLDEIRDYLQEHLPAYMIPQDIVPLPSFPLTANGKIDRKALPEPERSLARQRGYVAPRTELQKTILELWEVVLKTDNLGTDVNFFEAGGNSVAIVKVNNELSRKIDHEFTIADLFTYPTILEFEAFLLSKNEYTPKSTLDKAKISKIQMKKNKAKKFVKLHG